MMNIVSKQWTRFLPLASRSFAMEISAGRRCIQSVLEARLKQYPIYLDYQATTPTDPRVLDAMLPYFTHRFGNAHSKSHKYGLEAETQVELSRQRIADLIGANSKEIVFTSGATESNNLALKGVAHYARSEDPSKNHIITVQTEHKCVLETSRHLSTQGFEVTYMPVMKNGLIDLNYLKNIIKPSTIAVSIMSVNNEIGVIQPIKEIGKLCRSKGVYFHTDAAQALGKIKLNVDDMNIDLMSMSGHKIYGPKGIGAIYIRRKPRVKIESQIVGGGQERGYRSGTLAVPLVVGFGEACRLAKKEMDSDLKHIIFLNHLFCSELSKRLTHITFNGDLDQRYPGNINVSFAGVEGEGLMARANVVAVSSGSACTSESLEPSYVLKALGAGDEQAHTSIRIGLGRFTTKDEVLYAVDALVKEVNELREMSPLWEMIEEGIDISKVQWQHNL